jgi:hypothetical protein
MHPSWFVITIHLFILHLYFSDSPVDDTTAAAQAARAARAQLMFRTGGLKPPLQEVTNFSTGPTTPAAELESIRAGSKKANWTVLYQVRKGKANRCDGELGTGSLNVAGDTPMVGKLLLVI